MIVFSPTLHANEEVPTCGHHAPEVRACRGHPREQQTGGRSDNKKHVQEKNEEEMCLVHKPGKKGPADIPTKKATPSQAGKERMDRAK